MNLTCAQITGSADLCDGDDATGGGGGESIWINGTNWLSVNESYTQNINISGNLSIGSGEDVLVMYTNGSSFIFNFNDSNVFFNVSNFEVSGEIIDSYTTANFITDYSTNGWNLPNFTAAYSSQGWNLANHTAIPHIGNTTTDIRSQFISSDNISFNSGTGQFSINISVGSNIPLASDWELSNFTSAYSTQGWNLPNFTSSYSTQGWNILNDTTNWLTNFVANGWHISNDTTNWLTNYISDGYDTTNFTGDHNAAPHIGNTTAELVEGKDINVTKLTATQLNTTGSFNISSGNRQVTENSTCVVIIGPTSTLAIC